MSSRCVSADAFAEMLSAVVREHCDQFMQLENQELARLRTDVVRLCKENTELNEELASLKNADASKPPLGELMNSEGLPGPLTKDEQEGRGATECHSGTNSQVGEPAFTSMNSAGDDLLEALEAEDRPRQVSPSPLQHLESTGTTVVMLDLQKKFKDLDPHGKGFIDINVIADHMTQHLTEKVEREEQMSRYRYAVRRLNRTIGLYVGEVGKSTRGNIMFPAFEVIMMEDISVLQEQFGAEMADTLLEIRESLVDEVIVEKLARIFHVTESEIYNLQGQEYRRTVMDRYLEPLSGCMIMVNAFVIGFSLDTDPDWNGWFFVECFFSCFFVVEFVLNIYLHGCVDHFFGEGWCLSWFDCVVVWSAVLDSCLTALDKLHITDAGGGNSYHLLLLRLVRLVRIARILRVLRLKAFRDLSLMVNGVIGGLRTLFWAIVLLTFLLYVLGVFMRQVVAPEKREKCEASSQDCTRGQLTMDLFAEVLFGSVFRSMLTMFTCFTEGCTSPDGTPLIWHLWDTHGPILVLGYVAAFMTITFGVFNLIMAVMVQNTLENAAQLDAERQFGEEAHQARKAEKLHRLLGKLCRVHASPAARTNIERGASRRKGLIRIFARLSDGLRKSNSSSNMAETAVEQSKHLHLRIDQDQFDEMMRDKEVNVLFEDLDISGISRGQLFDILDADGSGYLSVSELVDGLMKLRGPADKGDVISACLSVRQLQKQVGKVEELIQKHVNTASAKPKSPVHFQFGSERSQKAQQNGSSVIEI